jgi:hypothetical protein
MKTDAPELLITDCDEAIRLFSHHRYSAKKEGGTQLDLWAEGETRLWQLRYCLGRFKQLVEAHESDLRTRHAARIAEPSPESERAMMQARVSAPSSEVEFYAEAFYYMAFRLTKVLQKLPPFKSFEAPGVRDVRNHLIEHPLVLNRNFVYGIPEGLQLKVSRSAGNMAPTDAGYMSTLAILSIACSDYFVAMTLRLPSLDVLVRRIIGTNLQTAEDQAQALRLSS